MANQKLSALTTIPAVDRAADLLYVVDNSGGTSNKVTPNALLGISGDPVGTSDIQDLTNKTITSPTITGPTLTGTLTGTYTLGGTPTFPAAVATLTGSQTLTNKILTSPTINTATIVNPTLTTDAVTGFTTSNNGTVYGITVTSGTIGSAGIASGAIDYTKVATGFCVQQVNAQFSAVATGTTTVPNDDTIPQNTEGTEFMTLAITPKATSNVLVIEITSLLSASAAVGVVGALFQDSTANALAASAIRNTASGEANPLALSYAMTAGTTSSTTFKFRAGGDGASTITFNGDGGNRKFGAIPKSSIVIREYKA